MKYLAFILLILFFNPETDAQDSRSEVITKEINISLRDGTSISGVLSSPISNLNKNLLILVSPPLGFNRNLTKIPKTSKIGMFEILADSLTKSGINVFRFDNRGVGLSDGANDSITLYTHANDVSQIAKYFQSQRYNVGLLGHSEGGLVAEVVAATLTPVSFLILLGTPGFGGWSSFRYQVERVYTINGERYNLESTMDSLKQETLKTQSSLFDTLEKYENVKEIRRSFYKFFNLDPDVLSTSTSHGATNQNPYLNIWLNPQQLALRKFNPQKYLSRIKCPVLAMNGSEDDFVDAVPNLDSISTALRNNGNSKVFTYIIQNVNHSFKPLKLANKGHKGVATKSEEFSNDALAKISAWIKKHDKL